MRIEEKNNVVADDDDYNETQIMFNFNYKTVFFFKIYMYLNEK